MYSFTISILNNKIFFEIINKIKLFSKFKIKHYDDKDLCIKDAKNGNQLIVFFGKIEDEDKINTFPLILINETKQNITGGLKEHLIKPFTIFDFEKKITSLISKNEFKKNSLIALKNYTIDKNERKLKKNNLELQLSEKEINFLILFSENKEPINRNFFLKNVWKYSEESETHTIETHIHRLRKKILEKFGDSNFIKNNNKGYYI